MKRDDFIALLTELQEQELEFNLSKGREYAQGDEDALLNFKRAADFLGLTPEMVCMVYMYKHFAAIASYTATGDVQSDESIRSRVVDLRLYGALFQGLVEERKLKSAVRPSAMDLLYRFGAEQGWGDDVFITIMAGYLDSDRAVSFEQFVEGLAELGQPTQPIRLLGINW